MGTDYDAWLEKPYQDALQEGERYDEASERYIASDLYQVNLTEWLEKEENIGKTESDYRESDWFKEGISEELYEESPQGDEEDYAPSSRSFNW
jgi:hypothetical protein